MTAISAEALRLLLRLFESPVMRFPRATIEHYGGPAQELVTARLLVPAGFDRNLTDPDDDEAMVAAAASEDRSGLEFRSHTQGRTVLDQAMLQIYAPDLRGTLARLGEPELRQHSVGPMQLDTAGWVWDLGSVRLGSTVSSVWFARRLNDREALTALKQELRARPAANLRLLLTTTSRALLPGIAEPNTLLASMDDFLSGLELGRIDWESLRALARGQPPQGEVTPVYLSPDNHALFIRGMTVVTFKGPKQKRLARLIVDAWNSATPIRAAEMLDKAHSSANSFDQVFGKQWSALRRVLKSDSGVWRFDI